MLTDLLSCLVIEVDNVEIVAVRECRNNGPNGQNGQDLAKSFHRARCIQNDDNLFRYGWEIYKIEKWMKNWKMFFFFVLKVFKFFFEYPKNFPFRKF